MTTSRARRRLTGSGAWIGLAPFLVLDRRRVWLSPTIFGQLYAGMIVALLVGSINHNNNLGYLLTFLLGSMLLVAVREGCRNLRAIEVTGGRAQAVFTGREARFAITLRASGDRFGLRLALDPERPANLDLATERPATVTLGMAADRRGVLRPRDLHLWTSFPLGLCTVRTRLPLAVDCVVYPRPLAGPHPADGDGDRGQHRPPRVGAGRDFSSLAPYRPGDSLQQLHWKSFARGQGLHTRVFSEQDSGPTLLDLDRVPGTDLEERLSRLCHLVLDAEAWGVRYGLRLGATTIEPGRGPGHRDRCLRALALHP